MEIYLPPPRKADTHLAFHPAAARPGLLLLDDALAPACVPLAELDTLAARLGHRGGGGAARMAPGRPLGQVLLAAPGRECVRLRAPPSSIIILLG